MSFGTITVNTEMDPVKINYSLTETTVYVTEATVYVTETVVSVREDKALPQKRELTSYGIMITLEGANDLYECCTINDISVDKERMLKFFNLLKDGMVTPVSLPYIVEDFLNT